MNMRNIFSILCLTCALCACASTAPLSSVQQFAAMSGQLDGFAELSVRYRDTYERERAYLSPAAEQEAIATDAMRRAAYRDFVSIYRCVNLYMDTLGTLAGKKQGDLSSRVKGLVSAIKAWPDSGLTTQQANAYTRLGQLITNAATASYQQLAAADMLRDGAAPMHDLLAAIGTLLSYYEKTGENEKKTVLGLYEVELPFLEAAGEHRLLLALAKLDYTQKKLDYSAASRRLNLVEKNLNAITLAHAALVQHLADIATTKELNYAQQ